MDSKPNQISNSLKKNFGIFLSISFGIFLFLLFFQPFPNEIPDMDELLLFKAGLGGIIFLIIFLIRIILLPYIQSYQQQDSGSKLSYFTGNVLITLLSSLSFAFYLRFVGKVQINFYIMFKVLIICIVPPVVLFINDMFNSLKQQIITLVNNKKNLQKQIQKVDDDFQNKIILFSSENKQKNFSLHVSDIVFFKSADKYIEVNYKADSGLKTHLTRNTLKKTEIELKDHKNFIRCHRTYIVNMSYVEKLNRSLNNYSISIIDYPVRIPVSQQYLLKIRENI